jgi:hypothetical protein
MVRARAIRAVSTHATEAGIMPAPTAEAIVIVPGGEGPFVIGGQVDIEQFGTALIRGDWAAGDPAISYPDLASGAEDGDRVLLVYKPNPEGDVHSD